MQSADLITVGIITVFVGVALLIIGSVLQSSKVKTEWAFGGFIGPIPFGFASREDLLKFIVIISFIFLLAFLLFNKGVIGR